MHVDKVICVARQERSRLLKLPGILGVGAGSKISRGKETSIYALLVYVRQKQPLDQIPRLQRIPKQIVGAPTDVIQVGQAPTAQTDELEHRFINYSKVHREHVKRRATEAPSTVNDRDIGSVAVIEDDPKQSFIITDRQDVDWVAAYRKFRLTHRDDYDFITFWSDFEVRCECGAF